MNEGMGGGQLLRLPVSAGLRRALMARRIQQSQFPRGMFGDPAWDLTLELYASWLAYGRTSVSELCLGAGVAPTTGLRWIAALCEAGLVRRIRDPLDGRRVFIELTEVGGESMSRYFETLGDANEASAPDRGQS
jgi:hypothetical protein